MNLYNANKQWAERPADERFWTLEEMEKACQTHAKKTLVDTISLKEIDLEVREDEIGLANKQKRSLISAWDNAVLTHWSFGEICHHAKAPAAYLRTLPTELAVRSLKFGFSQERYWPQHKLLLYKNGSTRLIGLTSPRYARIWNWQIVSKLRELTEATPGWRVPPARPAFPNQPCARRATKLDTLSATGMLSIKEGDFIAPAGLYASDHDCFVFLVNESKSINDGTERGLSKGIFISNSEVGASSFKVSTFLYRHVCGNHIVWGAKNVSELRIRHVGQARRRAWDELSKNLKKYADESPKQTEAMIKRTKSFKIAPTKEELVEKVSPTFVTKKQAEDAYLLALEHESEDGPPLSAWGFAQGVTRLSQTLPFADQRTELDKAAGKIIQMAR